MITRFSIVTLIIFILSIFFVIRPVSFRVKLPYFGHTTFSLNLTTAPILAILILWASQCIAASTIRHGIAGSGEGILPYNILILFFTLAYMAITLDISGVLQAAAFWVSNKGGSSGWRLYTYFYLMVLVLSVFLGNDPIILSGTVFLVYYTEAAKLRPMAWLISEFAAANTASMVLFVGNPTNVVVCEGFGINQAGFTAYTILPFLGCSAFCFLALVIQFRKNEYIIRKLPPSDHLDPRSVLRDPVAAIVGSFLLGSTLVVCLVVSFFHVDVWMISLPFAVAKFIFDIAWDHYKFQKRTKRKKDISEDSTNSDDEIDNEDAMHRALREHVAHEHVDSSHPDHIPDPLADSQMTAVNLGDPSGHKTSVPLAKTTTPGSPQLFVKQRQSLRAIHHHLKHHFPVFFTALPRLPFALVPFAFSQFILIEGLDRQGWIDVFGHWLAIATDGKIHPTVWIVGVMTVFLCNFAGTNIGATILLTKVVNAAPNFTPDTRRAAGISLAIASNYGAVSFTFSASLAGLLWDAILQQKGIKIKQREFAMWNMLPVAFMTIVGLAIVSAEMAVLYP